MFKGDYADTSAGKFLLVLMGAERRVSRAQTRERGPPSALAEIIVTGNDYKIKGGRWVAPKRIT